MTTTKPSTKISLTGYNKKEGQYYAVFEFDKNDYIITWRPKSKENGIEFDVGILPYAARRENGLNKRATRKKKSNETGTGEVTPSRKKPSES